MGGVNLSDLLWPDVSHGRQPQRPLKVSDRFSSRIERVIYPSCDRSGIVQVGTVGTAITAAGRASAHSSSGTNILRAKFKNPYISSNGWVGFLGQFVTTSTFDAVLLALGSDSGSSGNTLFVIGPTGSGTLKHLIGGYNSNTDWVDTGKVISDGKPHTVLLLSNGYQYKLFLDGKKLTEASTGLPAPGIMPYEWICAGSFRRTTDYPGGNVSVTLVASVVDYVTDNEAAELTDNPWGSVFKPPIDLPIVIPSAGGGATVITCNTGAATTDGIVAGISSATTIACNVGGADTAGVACALPIKIACNVVSVTTAGIACSLPAVVQCNDGTATTAGITAQVDIAGQIVIGCNAGTATTTGVSSNISSAFVLTCNAGTATTLGTTAYFPQSLQCNHGNAIAIGIDATFTVAGPTTIVCNVGNATASGIYFSFGWTLVDAPNGAGPAIIRPQTNRPLNVGGIRI